MLGVSSELYEGFRAKEEVGGVAEGVADAAIHEPIRGCGEAGSEDGRGGEEDGGGVS